MDRADDPRRPQPPGAADDRRGRPAHAAPDPHAHRRVDARRSCARRAPHHRNARAHDEGSAAMSFKDHFSRHAGLYAKARPHYPDALFDWIATDPSARQIGNAVANPRIDYRNEAAEHTSIADRSVDAVTVAQALHWFDRAAFIAEVRRVAKPGALFAAWCYANCSVTPTVDAVIAHLYDDVLGAYWSPERRLVDEGYASLEFPFTPIAPPAFEMRVDWNARQLLAYLTSWSAAQKYARVTDRDAVAAIADELTAAWQDPERVRPVRWSLAIRAGRVAH